VIATAAIADELELVGWRREVAELYAAVRQASSAQDGHALWRAGRDRLFQEHPQSPLAPDDPLRGGLSYAAYDPTLRWRLTIQPVADNRRVTVQTAPGESTRLRRLGDIALPPPINATIAVWWLEQYGGGLFIPIRDGTAGTTSYGGGRYLIDTTKGADLGDRDGQLTVDLNFLFNPSCRYDAQWQCPLAPADNVIDSAIHACEQI
jgi:uncharacterized protein